MKKLQNYDISRQRAVDNEQYIKGEALPAFNFRKSALPLGDGYHFRVLRHNKSGLLIIDVYRIGLSGNEVRAEIFTLFKVTVDLGANGISGSLNRYRNFKDIDAAFRFQLVKGGAAIGQATLNIDLNLRRVGQKHCGGNFFDRRQLDFQVVFFQGRLATHNK
jgi:hypothetical protein